MPPRSLCATVYFLICLLAAVAGVHAEDVEPMELLYRNWSTKNGIPHNNVWSMLRTRDGFLWVATESGLARFDGVRFETYGLREGLLSVVVRALFESSDGTLWVGTQGGGVSTIRDGRIIRTYTRTDGLPSASALNITEDSDKHVWVASGAGVVRMENGRFVPIPGVPGRASAIFRDREGIIWAGFSGLWRWEAGHWTREPESGLDAANCFCEDDLGRLWVGGSGHDLWCREADGWRLYNIPQSLGGTYVVSIAAERDGTIWGVMEGGAPFGLRNGQFVSPVPRGEDVPRSIHTIYVDYDGQLWMGSYSRGLYALTTPRTSTITLAGGEEHNKITALAEPDPGTFFVGTSAHGWFQWRDGQTSPLLEGADSSRFEYGSNLLVTRHGDVWAATNGALLLFQNGKRVSKPALDRLFEDYSVFGLCEDGGNGIWVGTTYGKLFHLEPGAINEVPFGDSVQPVYRLAQEADGTLWIGTLGEGLYRLHGTEHRHFGREDGIQSDIITALYLAPDGILWVGTAGGGLARREGEHFVSVTTPEGLPDDTVSQIILDDENRLWLGTNRGIAVIKREEVAAIHSGSAIYLHPRVITKNDGMPSEECMTVPPVKTSTGQFAFATDNGIVLLRPGDFHPDALTPPVFIQHILANDQPTASQSGFLSLPPNVDRLQIDFTALHFAAPDEIRFRYRLEGLESGWIEAGGRRSVDYSHLSPGNYRFEVTASIGNGLWNPNPATLDIALAPHFWQTWWFRYGAIALALGTVAFGVRRRERLRSQRKIETLERQRAIDAERARISRDLHDDVGSSLTQVALLSELAQDDLIADPVRAREHINEIFTTAKDVTRNLDEIVWAVNPAHDTLEDFVLYLCSFVQNYTRAAGLQSRLDIPKTLPDLPVAATTRHQLYLATKEALHNVVKHADATEIRLGLVLESQRFRLIISDNGKGFPVSEKCPDICAHGVNNLQQRLQHLGGSCTHASQPGAGTSVEMVVPLG